MELNSLVGMASNLMMKKEAEIEALLDATEDTLPRQVPKA